MPIKIINTVPIPNMVAPIKPPKKAPMNKNIRAYK
jgi:hypothetical protein